MGNNLSQGVNASSSITKTNSAQEIEQRQSKHIYQTDSQRKGNDEPLLPVANFPHNKSNHGSQSQILIKQSVQGDDFGVLIPLSHEQTQNTPAEVTAQNNVETKRITYQERLLTLKNKGAATIFKSASCNSADVLPGSFDHLSYTNNQIDASTNKRWLSTETTIPSFRASVKVEKRTVKAISSIIPPYQSKIPLSLMLKKTVQDNGVYPPSSVTQSLHQVPQNSLLSLECTQQQQKYSSIGTARVANEEIINKEINAITSSEVTKLISGTTRLASSIVDSNILRSNQTQLAAEISTSRANSSSLQTLSNSQQTTDQSSSEDFLLKLGSKLKITIRNFDSVKPVSWDGGSQNAWPTDALPSPFLSPEKLLNCPLFMETRLVRDVPSAANNRRLVKSNSCSTLFVNSTISQADLVETICCLGASIRDMICATHALGVCRNHDILSEELHPLYTSVRFSHATCPPTAADVTSFLTCLFDAAQLSAECAVISLIYIDRMLSNTDLTIHSSNWSRIVLGGVLLASKVWDDQAVWNVDFCTVFPETQIASLNALERFYIDAIRYNVFIRPSVYAKYYFSLRETYNTLLTPKTSIIPRVENTQNKVLPDSQISMREQPHRPLSVRGALKMEVITLTGQLRIREGPKSGHAAGPLWSTMFPSVNYLKGKYWNYRKSQTQPTARKNQFSDGTPSLEPHPESEEGKEELVSSPRIDVNHDVDHDAATIIHDANSKVDHSIMINIALPRKENQQRQQEEIRDKTTDSVEQSTYSLNSISLPTNTNYTAISTQNLNPSLATVPRKMKQIVRITANTGLMRRSVSDYFYEPCNPAVLM